MDNVINKQITPIELREQVLANSKEIMTFFESEDMKALLTRYAPVLYKRTFEKYRRLQDLEFRIAVAAGQSAGKSSVTNAFVVNYPLLPFCNVATTCVPTIIKYGKNIRIEITKQTSIDENGKKKVINGETVDVDCTKKVLPHTFKKLVDYFALCHSVLALGNVSYFTKEPAIVYETSGQAIEAKDLNLSDSDPKQVAMLYLTALCAYMQNNEDEEVLSDTQIKAREMQQELLKEIGLGEEDKLYTVTIYWDSPLLKKGLVFYDLPGLGSDNVTKNGYLSHRDITELALEEVQSMLYVFKKEVDAAGLDAVAQMLNSEAIRDLKSKQDRVIVALNKIDGMTPTAINASVESAKVSLKKFNLEPKIYPISALLYGEKQYTDKGFVHPYNTLFATQFRCLRIRDGKLVERTNVVDELEYYNEDYPGAPFLKVLNDYADISVVTNSLEFISSLYKLIEETYSQIQSLIDLYNTVGDSVTEANFIIKSSLEYLLNDIRTNFITNANKKIEEAFKQFKEGRFQEADDNLASGLEQEIDTLKERSLNYANTKFEKNINGNIVLYYRRRKKGRVYFRYKEPNYRNWESLIKEIIQNFQFAKPFSEYTSFLKNLVNEIRKKYQDIDEDILNDLEKEFDKIEDKIKKEVIEAKSKLRDAIESSLSDDEKMEEIYEKSVKSYDEIIEQFRDYVYECLEAIRANIGTEDTLDGLTEKLVKEVSDSQKLLNQVFKKITGSFSDKLEKNGPFRTKTEFVNKNELLNKIKTEFVLTAEQKKMYKDCINPELPIKNGCNSAVKHKKKSLNDPLNILNNRVNYMIGLLDPKNAGESEGINSLIDKNNNLLKELKGQTTIAASVDKAVNHIKNNPDYKNELKNIEGVDFTLLAKSIKCEEGKS